jgi:hypothetical protein
MMYIMSVLPREIDYAPKNSLPPGCQALSVVTSPINGSVFTPSSIIQFDLVQRGYMVPESMYIRYRLTTTLPGTAGASNALRGCPVYSPFQRSEIIVGSQVVESIQNYGQLCNFLVNSKVNTAQKIGLASCFGYSSSAAATTYAFDFTTNSPNGISFATSTTANTIGANISLAGPLGNLLSNAESLIPLKHMPSVRVQLSLDSLANIYRLDGTNPITNFSLSNLELCYDTIDFDGSVDAQLMARGGGMLTIKSQSYLSSGITLPIGSAGSLEFLYNQRLASIKSLFMLCAGATVASAVNLSFDSVDPTGVAAGQGGDFQFFIGGMPYPARPISTTLNRSAVLMELSASMGPAHDLLTSNFGFNPTQFNSQNNTVTTIQQPGTFYIGTNTEKLSTSNALLTGVSSQGSPISFRISINNATTATQVLQLVCLYDSLIQVDMAARTCVVMQ